MAKKETGVVIRVPAEIAEEVKEYSTFYRTVAKFKNNVQKELHLFKERTGVLSVDTTVTMSFHLDDSAEEK